ncbi:MAG: SgcJ/EcaC family oxidoreductase [Pirellulales bacterium]
MRRVLIATSVWLVLLTSSVGLVGGAETASDANNPDLAAIRAAVKSYTEAYNRGDAKAVAEHWSETAEWVSPSGQKIRGRALIEKALAGMFAELKGMKVELSEPTVRLVTSEVAVEEGTATVVVPGETPTASSYIAIHVKKDGKWKLDSVRETELAVEQFQRDGLDQLEWLVGEWVDNGPKSSVETTVSWSKNGAFLTAIFRVTTSEGEDLEGTQIIGWDPVARSIRSWMFDSDGGFGEGKWRQQGDRWIVSFSQTLADGSEATSTNIYQRVDDDSYLWQSIDRRLDGQPLPDIKEVKVVRAAQAKKAAASPAEKPKDAPADRPAPVRRAPNKK